VLLLHKNKETDSITYIHMYILLLD